MTGTSKADPAFILRAALGEALDDVMGDEHLLVGLSEAEALEAALEAVDMVAEGWRMRLDELRASA